MSEEKKKAPCGEREQTEILSRDYLENLELDGVDEVFFKMKTAGEITVKVCPVMSPESSVTSHGDVIKTFLDKIDYFNILSYPRLEITVTNKVHTCAVSL